MEAASRFELEIKALQASALPLGEAAVYAIFFCLERETGFEPATSTLARLHSTTELLPLEEGQATLSLQNCQAPGGFSRPQRGKDGPPAGIAHEVAIGRSRAGTRPPKDDGSETWEKHLSCRYFPQQNA